MIKKQVNVLYVCFEVSITLQPFIVFRIVLFFFSFLCISLFTASFHFKFWFYFFYFIMFFFLQFFSFICYCLLIYDAHSVAIALEKTKPEMLKAYYTLLYTQLDILSYDEHCTQTHTLCAVCSVHNQQSTTNYEYIKLK